MITSRKRAALHFLRAAGPGIVFALTVLGPGDLVSNTVTGATHGYALLWALGLALIFRVVWLDSSARYVMATGESLMDGYARFGNWLAWIFLGAMVVVRLLANLYRLALLANAVEVLAPEGWRPHRLLTGFAVAGLGYLLCVRGGYSTLEKIFKFLIALMCAALLAAAFLARPEPGQILRGMLAPSFPADRGLYGTAFILMALIGTEAGSLTNITYSYFLREKGWRGPAFQQAQRKDLLKEGISPRDASDLVVMFSGALGLAGRVIFTFGICAAAFSGFAGGTTGYALVLSDAWNKLRGCESGAVSGRRLYRLSIAFWCFAPLLLLTLTERPVWLVLAVNALMGACIPVLAVFLLLLTSDRKRMGNLANGLSATIVLGVLTAVSSWLLGLNLVEWLRGSG